MEMGGKAMAQKKAPVEADKPRSTIEADKPRSTIEADKPRSSYGKGTYAQ